MQMNVDIVMKVYHLWLTPRLEAVTCTAEACIKMVMTAGQFVRIA